MQVRAGGVAGHADAVFGSRYMAGEQTRVLLFWHTVINRTLTLAANGTTEARRLKRNMTLLASRMSRGQAAYGWQSVKKTRYFRFYAATR